MKLATQTAVPVYTVSGSSTARPLPEWLARRRKRSLKQDPEYSSRIELLQDFEFEEASQCVRISEDGDWVMSTGTYKPQIHTHNLPQLSLSFARHTNTLNTTFELLSSDYSKSIHLQEDRTLEFHTSQGCHYVTRIPRYGRDLKYSKNTTEALVPCVGLNENGKGEVFRLHLEHGKFLRSYEIDIQDDGQLVMADDHGGEPAEPSVNTAAVAEASHNLLAFGTSCGTVEFWDPRARDRVGILSAFAHSDILRRSQETTALEFHQSGLNIACGSSAGMIHLYDLRSPIPPLLTMDEGHHGAIKSLIHLTPSSRTRTQSDEPKLLSANQRKIQIWETRTGAPWTAVEANMDLHSVAWCKDSGMILTANEGRQQHIFFIPQLGPAPKWCTFLDNLVEEMAEDPTDPGAFNGQPQGEVYENYKFLTSPQLEVLGLSHLIGTTSLMRPYMHGYFVAQTLYEEARLISDPFILDAERAKKVRERVEKERESRIRGSKKIPGQVNRALAQQLLEKEERFKTRDQENDEEASISRSEDEGDEAAESSNEKKPRSSLLSDPRFSTLFTGDDFAIDETSREWQQLNPGSGVQVAAPTAPKQVGLTAVEQEELQDISNSSSNESEDEEDSRQGKKEQNGRAARGAGPAASNGAGKKARVTMSVQDSFRPREARDRSFGSRTNRAREPKRKVGGIAGERETTFMPEKVSKQVVSKETPKTSKNSRRSASGNVFRRM